MIQESYCSYEVAKLLKEKGFDEPCRYFYKFDSKERYYGTELTNSLVGDKIYNTCTHQMAMAWLRDKGVYVEVEIIITTEHKVFYHSSVCTLNVYWTVVGQWCDTYEEAVESALKYCLENLL